MWSGLDLAVSRDRVSRDILTSRFSLVSVSVHKFSASRLDLETFCLVETFCAGAYRSCLPAVFLSIRQHLNSSQWTECAYYTVSPKNIPNIFNCNFKKDYRILITFGTNISEQLAIKRLFFFLIQCLFLHYLGKTEPTKYYSFIQCGMVT